MSPGRIQMHIWIKCGSVRCLRCGPKNGTKISLALFPRCPQFWDQSVAPKQQPLRTPGTDNPAPLADRGCTCAGNNTSKKVGAPHPLRTLPEAALIHSGPTNVSSHMEASLARSRQDIVPPAANSQVTWRFRAGPGVSEQAALKNSPQAYAKRPVPPKKFPTFGFRFWGHRAAPVLEPMV